MKYLKEYSESHNTQMRPVFTQEEVDDIIDILIDYIEDNNIINTYNIYSYGQSNTKIVITFSDLYVKYHGPYLNAKSFKIAFDDLIERYNNMGYRASLNNNLAIKNEIIIIK